MFIRAILWQDDFTLHTIFEKPPSQLNICTRMLQGRVLISNRFDGNAFT